MYDKELTSPGNLKYIPYENRIKSSGSKKFSQQKIELSDTPLYFAEGFEKLFIAFYFIALPYIAGVLFLFFYVANGEVKLFLSLDQGSSFFLTWTIGYEILAGAVLLYIMKSAISFSREISRKGKKQKFQIP